MSTTKVVIDFEREEEKAYSEEELYELSTSEAIYAIRTLKVMLKYGKDPVIVSKDSINSHGQLYFTDFKIWMYVKEVD